MKNKIVFISSDDFSLKNFRGDLIIALSKAGFEVHGITPLTSLDYNDFSDLPIKIHRSNLERGVFSIFNLISEIIILNKIFNKIKPDYVVSYFSKAVVQANLVCILKGIKSRYSIIEGIGYSKDKIKNSIVYKLFFNSLMKICLKGSKKVFFNNAHDMSYYIDNIISPKQAILLGGIGVDLKKWNIKRTKKISSNKHITFIMVARLLKDKGVIEFCEAARHVKRVYKNCAFKLIGNIDKANPNSLSVQEFKNLKKIFPIDMIGFSKNVKKELGKADIFCLPTYYGEGLPRVIQEAMACSMPIITSRFEGVQETIVPGYNGVLINPRDSWALSAACIQYLENYSKIFEHGANSRKLAKIMYDHKYKSQLFIKHLKKP